MTQPVLKTRTLVTEDGVPIDAMHLPADTDLAIVLAHGFTLSWQHGAVWKVARRLNRTAGVIAFDFRGHGRSGGLSTLGDRETKDLAVAVAYARELGYRRIVPVGLNGPNELPLIVTATPPVALVTWIVSLPLVP